MSELALIMKTPIEDLIPAMLAWNNTELLEAVGQALKQYEGATYSDDQMDAAKKDRALLNAFIKTLNDERIRIGKVYSAPYDKFKAEVDEVISKVKETVNQIDTQVKAYDFARKEKRYREILKYYDSVVGDLATLMPYERIHQDKWLNASTSMKSIKTAIDQVVTDVRRAIVAIEAMHSQDEELVKAYYFRTLDLSAALLENDRLKLERERIAELNVKQQEDSRTEARATVPVAPSITPDSEAKPELTTICFKVEATTTQLRALREFLINNDIKFSKI